MNTKSLIVLVMFAALVSIGYAQDAVPEENIWADAPAPAMAPQPRQLTPERIEQFLDRLEQRDPEKAKQLRQLQIDDTKAFEQEIRQITKNVRLGMMDRKMDDANNPDRRGKMRHEFNREGQDGPAAGMHPMGAKDGGRGDEFRERIMEHKQEFENWLKTNHPEEAVELEKLQGGDQQAYRQKLMETMRKYGQIFRAEKENPELATVMKKDMQLKDQSIELVDKINAAADTAEKEKLTAQLQQVISERFDLIVKRKHLQVQDMEKKLAELQAKVAEKKTSLTELEAKKEAEVKARMEELLSKQEKINWD